MTSPTGAVRTQIRVEGESPYVAAMARMERAAQSAAAKSDIEAAKERGRAAARDTAARAEQASLGRLGRARQSATAGIDRMNRSIAATRDRAVAAARSLAGMAAPFAVAAAGAIAVGAGVARAASAVQEYTRVVTGHTTAVSAADAATAGLIDTLELHRQAARLEQAGLRLSAQEYQSVASAALAYARATGTDATQAHRELTQAVMAGSRQLRAYGVDVSGAGSQAERSAEAIRQLTERHAGQTTEVANTQEAIYALKNAWGTAWAEMGAALERESGPIMRTLQSVTSMISGVAAALETQRRAAENVARMGATQDVLRIERELRALGYDPATGRVTREETMLGTAAGLLRGQSVERIGRERGAQIAQLRAQLAEAQQREIDEARSGFVIAAPTARPGQPEGEDLAAPRGGGRRAAAIDEAAEAERRLLAVLGDVLGAVEDQEGARRANLEVSEAAAEAERAHIGLLQTQQAKRIELAEQEAAARQAAADAREAEIQAEREATAARIQMIEQVLQATQQAGQITQGIFGSVQTIIAQTGKSAEEQAKAEGRFLVAYSVVQAIIEGARAIAAFASQRYAAGAMHVLSAAAFGVAAAAAGSKLGGGGGAVAVAPPPRPAPEPQDRRQDSGGQTVIHNYSLGRTSAEAGHSIRRLEWEADRRGSGRSGTPGVGYS